MDLDAARIVSSLRKLTVPPLPLLPEGARRRDALNDLAFCRTIVWCFRVDYSRPALGCVVGERSLAPDRASA